MKSYTLKFKKADFASTSLVDSEGRRVWQTPVTDLYDNNQYRNYTVRRSNYGTNLLGNGVYTGIAAQGTTASEIGYIDQAATPTRFVDTSGQIDIIGWTFDVENITSNSSIQEPQVYLDVYNGPTIAPPDGATPSNYWAIQGNIRSTGTIYMVGAYRYSYFELHFNIEEMTLAEFDTYINNFDITFWIRIEIDAPSIDAFFSRTGAMLNKFPQWMDMHETDPTDPAYLQMSTPASLGGKFLNAVAGEWLTDLRSQIDYQSTQYYIDTVDLSQKAWVYRTSAIGGIIHKITGDGKKLAATTNIGEFHSTIPSDDAYYWNKDTDEIYCNVAYIDLRINDKTIPQELYQIWNCVDDLGAALDIRRHRAEDNESFRSRIRDVYINKPGVALEAFKNAVRRELNLWQYWSTGGVYQDGSSTPSGATPNSYFVGATPNVLEMSDIEEDLMYFDERGNPKQRFKELIEELAINYPITWGYFRYGQSFWDPDGILHKGFKYLSRTYDATPLTSDLIDSGVGDGNDLFLLRPDVKSKQVEFNTKLKVRGRTRANRVEYQPVAFDIAVYGQASQVVYNNPPFIGWFTIEVVNGGVTYFANVEVITISDVDATMATPSSMSTAVIEWANPPGATPSSFTSANFLFYNRATGALYDNGGATPSNLMMLKDITSVTVKPGRWNPYSVVYEFVPPQANYRAWFVDPTSSILGLGGSPTSITKAFNHAITSGTFEVESRLTAQVVTDGYFDFPASTGATNRSYGNYLSVPDSPELDITGDICIVTRVALDAWTGAGVENAIVSKYYTSNTRGILQGSWYFGVATNGMLKFTWTPDGGTTVLNAVSTAAPAVANGGWLWIAVAVDVVNSTNKSVAFFTSANGSSWTQLGTTVTTAGNTSIYNSSAPVMINGLYGGETGEVHDYTFTGNVSHVSIRNGIGAGPTVGGVEVFKFDALTNLKNASPTIESFPSSTGQLVTIGRTSDGSTQTVVVPTTTPFRTEPHHYKITLNNASPPTSPQNFTLALPPINFPPGTSATEIIVEILTAYDGVFGATGTEIAATPFFVPASQIKVDGNATWTAGRKTFSPSTASIVFSTDYSITIPVWSAFEASQASPTFGIIDANGPWRENQKPPESNTSNILNYFTDLTRNSFGIPNTTDYIITWIGVDTVSSPDVTVWIDSNTVIPAVSYGGESMFNQTVWPSNAIQETLVGATYRFSAFPIYAQLNPQVNEQWLPNVHSGYFYDDEQEYYLYASPNTITSSATQVTIGGINRQGAPILVSGINAGGTPFYDMRQVSNFIMDTNATPATPSYSLIHSEIKQGDGTTNLFAAYDNIYNVTVKNLTLNTAATPTVTQISDNKIVLNAPTLKEHEYEIKYRVRKSYYVEQINDTTQTKVVFDEQSYPTYGITYETALFDPATPVPIPLNTLYTSVDEGFIYIDHDVRPLGRIEVSFSPARILADGTDYGLLTVRSLDNVGNPKPLIQINLYTNFGTLDRSSVTTDSNGFAFANLTSELLDDSLTPSPATPALPPPSYGNGYLGRVLGVVTGTTVNAFADFNIQVPPPRTFDLAAAPIADAVLADGESAISIVGKVRDADLVPQRNALVWWRKGRYVYNVLTGTAPAFSNNSYFYYTGQTAALGTRVSTPDTNALDILGDLTIVARIKAELGMNQGAIVAKYATGGNASYAFRINNTLNPMFVWYDGVGANTITCTATVITDWQWVAVTIDVDNGGAGRTVKFWTSRDGANWTQLGTDSVTTPATVILNSTAELSIGAQASATDNTYFFKGGIDVVSVRNGIGVNGLPGGAEVFRFQGSDLKTASTTNGTTFRSSSNHLMTINNPAPASLQVIRPTYMATPGQNLTTGYVTTDVQGRFVIEPFISAIEPGYWFVSVESSGYMNSSVPYVDFSATPIPATPYYYATPNMFTPVGDVVAWYEYPNVNAASDPITNLPIGNNQDATPYWELPNYTYGSKFPINYDESNKLGAISSATPQWTPPAWYAIDRYRQYQMGLRGSSYYIVGSTPTNADYRDH